MLARRHPRARSNLKLSERASRRLRLGRATLFLLGRFDHQLPARLVVGFELLERASPSLAEYLCPAFLDYFYWRGARAELARPDRGTYSNATPERTRNARLRRVDWRFLLPDPSPKTTVCYDAQLRGAVALVSDRVLLPADTGSGCDLAVLADPDLPTLTAARERLTAGSACYVEWSPRRLHRARVVKRRLEEAGYESVQTYWPWPNRAAAHVWLPMDSRAALRYYLATRATRRGILLRVAHAVAHIFGDVALRIGVAPGIVVIARKPAPDGLGSNAPADLPQLLLTGGPRSVSKAVIFRFPRLESTPRSVVKMNRTSQAKDGILREVDMLRYLERERPNLPGVPRIIAVEEATSVVRAVETTIIGRPMHGDLRLDSLARRAALVTDWVVRLAGPEIRRNPPRWSVPTSSMTSRPASAAVTERP